MSGIVVTGAAILGASASAAAQDAPVYEVEAINAGLAAPPPETERATPMATLDFFLEAVREQRFDRAAHALDLGDVPVERQSERGAVLARQLGYLLLTGNVVDWDDVPDTPDAQLEVENRDGTGVVDVVRRRSVPSGTLAGDGRDIPVHLRRVRADGEPAVWLISRFTLAQVGEAYRAHGGPFFEGRIPEHWVWRIVDNEGFARLYAVAALFGASGVLGALAWAAARLTVRLLAGRSAIARAVGRSARLVGLTTWAVTFAFVASRILVLDGSGLSALRVATWAAVFVLATMLVWRLAGATVETLSRRLAPDDADEVRRGRGIKTNVAVAKRVLLLVVIAVGLGLLLAQLGVLSSVGLSLAVSTGLVGAVLALAAQPIFANLVSSMQIAATRLVEIGDIVVVDGTWGRVEDIAFAYVVIRTWTNKRLIVPHDHLFSRPFENWSRHDDAIMRPVEIYVDYDTDIAAVREAFEHSIKGDERCVGPTYFAVTELRPHEIKVEAWVTGPSTAQSWYLHNDVRERMLACLQAAPERRLPRIRHAARPFAVDRPPPSEPAGEDPLGGAGPRGAAE
ncbi:MAG: mechanosensitive ion channel family protein [Alphaproteobacteria bacterium]